jgi:hypothetical protein
MVGLWNRVARYAVEGGHIGGGRKEGEESMRVRAGKPGSG